MKLRITLLTAATLTAFSFAAHAAEKGTIMIMVNSLDNPYYASEAKGASEKAQARLQNHRAVPWRRCQKQNELIDTAIGKKCRALFSITLTPPPASPPLKKPKSGHSGGLN